MNFRQLVDNAAKHKDPTVRPKSMWEMSEICGVSRPYIYCLFRGDKVASSWTIERIAKGLKLPKRTVRLALLASREEGGKS